MFTLETLTAALNDPTSPARQMLLDNLSRSPLDPAAAMQQLTTEVARGGLPPEQPPAQPTMAETLDGQKFMPRGASVPIDYTPRKEGQGPWSLDWSGADNGAAVTNPDNPAFVPPAAAAATGTDPQAQTSGLAATPEGNLKALLEGAAGMPGTEQPRTSTPGTPSLTHRWNPYQAQMLQTAGVARPMSLADLIGG
jgi:hypothetical protein